MKGSCTKALTWLVVLSMVLLLLPVSSLAEASGAEKYPEHLKIRFFYRDKAMGQPNMVEDDAVKAYLEDKFNITIDYTLVPSPNQSEVFEKLNLLIASNDIPDVMHTVTGYGLGREIYQALAENEQLVNIGQKVVEDPARWPLMHQRMQSEGLMGYMNPSDGEYYCLPVSNNPWDHVLLIRQDWLDKLGLAMPTTVFELRDVLEKFVAEDPDGQKNVGLTAPSTWFLLHIITAFTGTWGYYDDGEKLVSEWLHPGQKEGVAFLADMMQSGLIDKDIFTHQQYQDEIAKFVSGRAGVLLFHMGAISREREMRETFPDARVSLVPLDLSGPGGNTLFTGLPWYEATSIWSGCKDPDRVLDLLEFLLSEEGIDLYENGVEGIHYTIAEDGERIKNLEALEHDNWGYPRAYSGRHWWTWQMVRLDSLPDKDAMLEGDVTEEVADAYIAGFEQLLQMVRDGEVAMNPIEGLPVDAWEIVGSRPSDVTNTYYAEFLIGEKNVEEHWDKMIEEYRAAGYDLVEAEVNEKYYQGH